MKPANYLGLGALVFGLAAVGCDQPKGGTQKAPDAKPSAKAEAKEDDHDHAPGPHKGVVFDFGPKAGHAEFCMDHGKKQATVYILDSKQKNAAPIPASSKLQLSIKSPAFQVDLAPSPQDGDPAGKASRFVATHDNFGKEQEFEGTVSGEIDGKPYAGDFKEEEHDHKKK